VPGKRRARKGAVMATSVAMSRARVIVAAVTRRQSAALCASRTTSEATLCSGCRAVTASTRSAPHHGCAGRTHVPTAGLPRTPVRLKTVMKRQTDRSSLCGYYSSRGGIAHIKARSSSLLATHKLAQHELKGRPRSQLQRSDLLVQRIDGALLVLVVGLFHPKLAEEAAHLRHRG
jgi:hypothetical protein